MAHEECDKQRWSIVTGVQLAGCFLQLVVPPRDAPPSSHSHLSFSVPLPLESQGARLGEDTGLKITLGASLLGMPKHQQKCKKTNTIVLMKCSQEMAVGVERNT